MRIMPLITAALVTVFLFFLVVNREQLMAFAQAPATEAAVDAPTDVTPEAPVIRVVVQHSEERQIESAVILRGRTEAARQVEVRAETGGIVVSDPLRKGAYVNAGDVLCQIDVGTREATLAQADAALREAELNLSAAQKLIGDGYASESRLRSAEAAVSGAKAGVEAAQRDLENTKIRAPFAGLLETDAAELGSLLSAGGLCATVIQLDTIKLVGFVPELDVSKIEVGAPAGARLASGQEVMGRVTFLSRSADETTRTFRVEIEIANTDLSIRDGQTAEILIGTDGRMAHLLPQSALTLNDEGVLGLRVVDDAAIVSFVPVEMVRDSVEGVWLTGLPAAADVIVIGQEYVVEGVKVAPTMKETAQ